MKNFKRITGALLFGAAGAFIFSGIVGMATFYRMQSYERHATELQNGRMNNIAHFLSVAASDLLYRKENTRLSVLMNEVARGQDVAFAGVVNGYNRLLAFTDPELIGREADGLFPLGQEGDVRIFSAPVFIGDQAQGTVKVGFSLAGVNSSIAAVKDQILYGGLWMAGIGSLFLLPFLFGVWMLRGRLKDEKENSEVQKWILEKISHGIIRVNAVGRVIFINEPAIQILQMPKEKWTGKQYQSLSAHLPWDIRRTDSAFESQITLPDGSNRLLSIERANDMKSGKPRGFTLTITDVTAKKVSEERMERKSKQMELLSSLNGMMNSSLASPDRVVNRALNHVMDGLQLEMGWILLHNKVDDKFETVAQKGLGNVVETLQEGVSNGKGEYYRVMLGEGKARLHADLPNTHPLFNIPPLAKKGKSRGLLEIPLKSKETAIGVLGFLGASTDPLKDDEKKFLEDLGSQIGSLIDHAYKFEKTRKKVSSLSNLHRASQVVSGADNMEELLQTIPMKMVELVSAKRCALFLYNKKRNLLYGKVGYGIWDVEVQQFVGEPSPLMDIIMNGRKARQFSPLQSEERQKDPYLQRFELLSALFIPIIHRTTFMGILVIDDIWKERKFTGEEIMLAMSFARHVANTMKKLKETTKVTLKRATAKKDQQLVESASENLVKLHSRP